MGRQTEAYRNMHPEQFSDSQVVKKGKLDRDFLDYYFETLTNRNMDKQFEELCRNIAESEICPNLLPQTGPTGGGDSKVDSETYPVSDSITEMWFGGSGNKAGNERWAFAISAKKDWKAKVKSDVKKIVNVNSDKNRGYTKIFFMSNQFISDKKRADCEDELRIEYGIDVRILDKTWLLNKVMSSQKNKEIAVKSLELSENLIDEIEIGKKDYERNKRLDEIENRLKDISIKPAEKVQLVQEAVILGRELELTEDEVLGLIDRSLRVVKEYGNKVDLADSYYDAAWTVFWWYSNDKLYYSYYKEYEKIALEEDNVNLFSHLVTLWINIFSLSHNENSEIPIQEHTKRISDRYQRYIEDISKPNTALEAKMAFLFVRLLSDEDINFVVQDMMEILDESIGHLDLELYPLQRVIQEFPLIETAEKYGELFEKMISVMSKKNQRTDMAVILAKKAHSIKKDKPYEALGFFSRTLMAFYNESDKNHLIAAVMEMAELFDTIGLFWASRNFYYYVFSLCLNQYMKFGNVNPALFLSANILKYLEVKLGHVLYAVEFDALEKMARTIYPGEINSGEDEENNFDAVLAIQILRTPIENYNVTEKLPAYLEAHGLVFSMAAAKYILGYYDENFLEAFDGDKEKYDAIMHQLLEQPASKQFKAGPWYGKEQFCVMSSHILGCNLEIYVENTYEHGEIEIATTILASIESFLGTGVKNNLISVCGNITIEVKYKEQSDRFITAKTSEEEKNKIVVTFSDYKPENIISVQNEFAAFNTELIAKIVSLMFSYGDAMNNIEKMIKNDAALDRAYLFSNSIFCGMETLGKDLFLYDTLLKECEIFPQKRKEAIWKAEKIITKRMEDFEVHFQTPLNVDFKNISNEDMLTTSVINIPLWDEAKWSGVMYLADIYRHNIPPYINLLFQDNCGRKIFEEWKQQWGDFDENNQLELRIIKNIDCSHPYHYRVVIGTTCMDGNAGEKTLIMFPARVHTMTPENNKNLKMFENELKIAKKYCLCLASFDAIGQPMVYEELKIEKKLESIKISDACDIPRNDTLFLSGILPDDNPVIPEGKENAPILDIIKYLKELRERKK